jgi:hypothetical protein
VGVLWFEFLQAIRILRQRCVPLDSWVMQIWILLGTWDYGIRVVDQPGLQQSNNTIITIMNSEHSIEERKRETWLFSWMLGWSTIHFVDPIFIDSIFILFPIPSLILLLQRFLSLFSVYHPLFLLLAHIFYMYAYHSTSQMFFLSLIIRILITPFCDILHYFIGIQNIMLLFLFL